MANEANTIVLASLPDSVIYIAGNPATATDYVPLLGS